MMPGSDGTVLASIVPDAQLCRDCQACTLGCSLYHEHQCSPALARLRVSKDMARYTFAIAICRQCAEPDCVLACPNEAMRRDARGLVTLHEDECLHCGACAAACPYQAIFYDEAADRYLHCDHCLGRAGGPLCVELCPVGALRLGEA
jgi:Fe-S-cluster-containing dehydrogenase component